MSDPIVKEPDFKGWATKNDLLCSDGRTIRHGAFSANDGKKVPLVWNHQHDEIYNVLGHAILHNAEGGMRVDGYFNDTESGRDAKTVVHNGDIVALSIWANQLKQTGKDVFHGDIKEVSLVLAGANPGASIDTIIKHSDNSDEEAIVYTDEPLEIEHADDEPAEPEDSNTEDPAIEHADDPKSKTPAKKPEPVKPAEDPKKPVAEETVQDVFNTLNEKQKNVVYNMIAESAKKTENLAQSAIQNSEIEGENSMKHNVFDEATGTTQSVEIAKDELMHAVMDGKKVGSMKEAFVQHGIENIDYMFPDAKLVNPTPGMITRKVDWVAGVMSGVHNTPFSRIKSLFANLTEADARAKGYVKGKQKVEEVFGLLKRTTTPTTVYKKQKLDRDDVVDITDFDVVLWLKGEMRFMLDEEIARAILVGDGRSPSSDDHINDQNIRPIWTDDDLYCIKKTITVAGDTTSDARAKMFIQTAVRARKEYKGSGNTTLYTTEDVLVDCLLMEDKEGRVIYDDVNKLATMLRVTKIVTVPVMEGLTRVAADTKTHTLMGIIVNLNDYNVGADKGGAVSLFDDFDIDFNAQKYLIETRCSGALTVPYSAIVVESIPAA